MNRHENEYADSNKLITIGELSRLSGIHQKALRYYEDIGILTPVYITPHNRYRYFSHAQITYVKVIKLCAEYGIPLRDFSQFVDQEQVIAFDQIIALAEQLIRQKVAQAHTDLAYIQSLTQELALSENVHRHQTTVVFEEAITYWRVPFSGELFSTSYYRLINAQMTQQQLNVRRQGVGFMREQGQWQAYVVLQCVGALPDMPEQCVTLPAQTYVIEHVAQSELAQKLEVLLATKPVVLFLETFENALHTTAPHLECRYPYPDTSII